MIKAWLQAFRLRTLPLALSCIGMGSFLAAQQGSFRGDVLGLCILTTIFLQILSNLANDYGDSVHGADSEEREGPSRMVQTGVISLSAMKKAMIIFTILSLVSGISLLVVSLGSGMALWLFLGLGILSIIAAITYTAGSNPYGYAGLGDISVLIFFGLVGVLGTYYLHAQSFSYNLVLPALSCGFFATAVLNVNNVRDIESDKLAGKRSIPVRIGRKNAVIYHWVLILGGLICTTVYVLQNYTNPWQFLFLASAPLLLKNGFAVQKYTSPKDLDPYLKQMALSTLVFVLLFGIGGLI
ncbi:1,4-dihydroxy-2-naphthoate polyprenyltransferase [Sediminitomix flava]|uniref:1,4-dihydroxy-2-naphthoate octaprenyltransferase n=1 Tax=Sediminitomix flava TaxID=379075 RepID=A0A315ZBW4_SEDFL|nr:1,4-dihydroxy-2-naphthoate polyprenyltransferase [Sediminitomix flava]PWJ42792.1 1,4-dihydroxy-2-naphthoate prenyltransferase [Sediminitomix flava]